MTTLIISGGYTDAGPVIHVSGERSLEFPLGDRSEGWLELGETTVEAQLVDSVWHIGVVGERSGMLIQTDTQRLATASLDFAATDVLTIYGEAILPITFMPHRPPWIERSLMDDPSTHDRLVTIPAEMANEIHNVVMASHRQTVADVLDWFGADKFDRPKLRLKGAPDVVAVSFAEGHEIQVEFESSEADPYPTVVTDGSPIDWTVDRFLAERYDTPAEKIAELEPLIAEMMKRLRLACWAIATNAVQQAAERQVSPAHDLWTAGLIAASRPMMLGETAALITADALMSQLAERRYEVNDSTLLGEMTTDFATFEEGRDAIAARLDEIGGDRWTNPGGVAWRAMAEVVRLWTDDKPIQHAQVDSYTFRLTRFPTQAHTPELAEHESVRPSAQYRVTTLSPALDEVPSDAEA